MEEDDYEIVPEPPKKHWTEDAYARQAFVFIFTSIATTLMAWLLLFVWISNEVGVSIDSYPISCVMVFTVAMTLVTGACVSWWVYEK